MRQVARAFFLCCIIYLLYGHTLHGPFVYDDIPFIVQNSALRGDFSLDAIHRATQSQLSRPVTFITFMLNYRFHQLDVFGYRIVNLFIHMISSLCVWWLCRLLINVSANPEDRIASSKNHIAFLAAVLFAVHPVQTQAVSFISQRVASLATMLYLLSFCCYIKGRIVERRKALYFIASFFAGLIGMFTKEIVFTLPMMILLFEVLIVREGRVWERQNAEGQWRMSKLKVGIFMIPILLLLLIIPWRFSSFNISQFFTETIVSRSHEGDVLTFATYGLTQLRVVAILLRLFFIPVNQNFDYDFPMSHSLWEWPTFLCGLVLVAFFALAWKLKSKHRLISFGLFWFLLTISVNFIPRAHIIAEHKLYLTSIGLCIAATVGLFTLIKNFRNAVLFLSIIIVLFSFLTYQRNMLWRSAVTLWEDVVKKSPQKERAYMNLADAYIKERNLKQAIKTYSQVIALQPDSFEAYNARGLLYQETNNFDLALKDYNRSLSIEPKNVESFINRGNFYWKLNRLDKALEDYNAALNIKGHDINALNNRAALFIKKKEYDLALKDLSKALDYNSSFAEGYVNRGNLYFKKGELDRALRDYNQALHAQPSHAQAVYNRALVYINQAQYDLALDDLNIALQADPNSTKLLQSRAKVFIKKNLLSQALSDLDKIIQQNPKDAASYYLRSVTYYGKGRLVQARQDLMRAQKLGYPIPSEFKENIDLLLEKQ